MLERNGFPHIAQRIQRREEEVLKKKRREKRLSDLVCVIACVLVRARVRACACPHFLPSVRISHNFVFTSSYDSNHEKSGINQSSFKFHQKVVHMTVFTQHAPIKDMWSPLAGEAEISNLGS